jgi:hypothetical protein
MAASNVHLNFQAPEHRRIGDRLLLCFDDGNIAGADFRYAGPGFGDNLTLSYGQIVALASDFYCNCQTLGDAEQISDLWHAHQERSV